ncbi:MAG: PAS domain S-box protein [Acidobacteria bacterium]|nr:PAS domain S-box protein [Acidobacteriota bacterium]
MNPLINDLLPHLTTHWWIYLLSLIVIGFAVRAGHRRRVRWIHRSEQELARRVVERTRELEIEIEQRRATEAALNESVARSREAHHRLRFQVERMPLAFIAWDRDLRVSEWNQAAVRIFGWTSEEAIGKGPSDLVASQEPRQGVGELLAAIMDGSAGEDANQIIEENIAKDGTKLYCEWFTSPIRDEAGNVTRILSMANDITERRWAQEHQRLEAERTSFLLDLHRLAPTLTDREIYEYVLEKAAVLTSSRKSYLSRISDDETGITTLAMSKDGARSTVASQEAPTPLSSVGPWADAARQRRPVVHNRYRQTAEERGLAAQDTNVTRHMGAPVIEGGSARLLLGVADKPSDYTNDDVTRLQLVANELHKVITARRAEESLRQSEARNRGVLQAIPDLIFVLTNDGVLLDHKAGRNVRLSAPSESLLGRPIADVLPPDAATQALACLHQALTTGEVQPFDYELTLPGETAPRSYNCRMSAIAEDQALLLVQDVTDRRRSERERASLFTAIEQAGESVVITDPDGIILYCNPAVERTSGYNRAEIIGRKPSMTKSGRQDADFYRKLWATITAGKVWMGRFTNRRRDGTLYEEDATISPIHDESGRISGYVAVKRDVTQQSELEAQLWQAQKLESIGRLAGGIAHDFNNLLTVINGYSDLMYSRLPESGRLREWLSEIRKAGAMASDLTQQLLAFSRKRIIEPKPLELNQVVHDTREMLRRIMGEDIEFETALAPNAGQVLADTAQLHQVLMNLTVNARDAMPTGGKLTIETSKEEFDEEYCAAFPDLTPGSYVRLSVSDTGAGMDEETQRRIFEPFFTTKDKGLGTGLGLSTVYGIVRQCSGAIRVHSRPGLGTQFEVFLPRLECDADIAAAVPILSLLGGSETVLVVEDQDDVRRLAVDALRSYGFRVLETASGGDALVLVQHHSGPIHLMLTDVVMPRMTGKELAERLKNHRPLMQVLFMSGYAEDVIAHHGVLDQGVDFIPKPFTPEGLARKVREMLGRDGVAAAAKA